MARPVYLECVHCGHRQLFQPLAPTICEACQSAWVEAHYDYTAFKRDLLRGLPGRTFDLWRYQDVLPVQDAAYSRLTPAGGTPLHIAHRYARHLDHAQVYIKDERFGPTSSFKDRQAAVAVAAMAEAGVGESVIASTGNAAVAYAAACARLGIKLWVFMTSMVPAEKLREVALFGAEVIKVTGTYDQTKQIAVEFARRRGLLYDRGASSLAARESMKTIAYEIVEQLGWRAPDWYIQSVSGGLGPMGVYHGFQELHDMGLIDRLPALGIIQAQGCAPMVKAFKAGRSQAEPVEPDTRIAILSTGDPGKTYTYLWELVQRHGGTMEAVSDEEAFASMRTLAKLDGMAVEPATAVAFAGLEKMLRHRQVSADQLVVVNCTGHTFPVEKHVLGDQWTVDFSLHGQPAAGQETKTGDSGTYHEGLTAALERLDERTTTVLIVDDNPDDAELIRRFLQARRQYRIFHAADGWDGLTQARQRLPDLILLDLMMPELDGFSLLEELKLDKRTQHIPIIVVSAKDLTASDQRRLNGHIHAIYQKGRLQPKELAAQVVEVLEKRTSPEGDE